MNYNPGIEDQSGSLLLRGYEGAAESTKWGAQALGKGISAGITGVGQAVQKVIANREENKTLTELGGYYFQDPEKLAKFEAAGLSAKKGMLGAAVAEEARAFKQDTANRQWFEATDTYTPGAAVPMQDQAGQTISYYLPQSRRGGTQVPVRSAAAQSNVAEDVVDSSGQVIGKTLNGKFVPGSAAKPLSPEEIDAGRREDIEATRARINLLGTEITTPGAGLLPAGSGVAGESKSGELTRLKKQLATAERARAIPQSTTAPAPIAVNAPGGSKALDRATAMQFLQQAGGDKERARALARQAGYTF